MIQVFSDIDFKRTNAYLIYNENKKGILIDTAFRKYREIIDFAINNNIEITDIFITHGHFGHFYGINEITEILNYPNVYIGKDDLMALFDPSKNTSGLYDVLEKPWAAKPIKNLRVITEQCSMMVNGYNLQIYTKPGHTIGSIMLDFVDLKSLFNGDSLFLKFDVLNSKPSEKSNQSILENIKWILETYSREYSIYPGHFDCGFTIRDVYEKSNIIKKRYFKYIFPKKNKEK